MSGFREGESDFITDYTLHAGRLKRYHTWAVHHQQTVGEHCWQKARIYETIFGPPTAEVERFIRHHDTAELVVGDPPFPVKKDNPQLKSVYDGLEIKALDSLGVELPLLAQEERHKIKICDLLEMMEFGMVEREMGNRLAIPIIQRTRAAAITLALTHLSDMSASKVEAYVLLQTKRHLSVMTATY